MDETINAQQIAYYRARAAEYDEWFYRTGRYDRGVAANARWFRAAADVRAALYASGKVADILELACGTGIWTQELARHGQHVTAIDAAPEVLAINRAKLGNLPNVEYQQHDLFAWQPERRYDLVFMGFWLSHVPPLLLDPFLATAVAALREGGKLFVVDSLPSDTSIARDHAAPDTQSVMQQRRLNDGQEYTIVKVYYTATSLNRAFAAAGLHNIVTHETEEYFVYAQGIVYSNVQMF